MARYIRIEYHVGLPDTSEISATRLPSSSDSGATGKFSAVALVIQ